MRPISEMPDATAAAIRVVFTDIDDTLTSHGTLPACAYQALEDLTKAGIAVAPITGRPAGWCDMIARMWPVTGVVGENGAFYFAYDHAARKMRRAFAVPDTQRAADRIRLHILRDHILAQIPGAAVSADQLYREADLAIDFCEDVDTLPKPAVARIKAMFEAAGAVAKISSIHVNGWFGDYDKLTMTRRLATEILGLDLETAKTEMVFVGDSPNDAPMFGYFPNSCGVANVLDFKDEMAADPAYVTRAAGGHGFVELAERLLAARKPRG